MASDATYFFFKREFDDDDKKASHAPFINTARVVRKGGLRGGSVPPVHFVQKVSRAGSVPPPRSVVIGGGVRGVGVRKSAPFSRLSVATPAGSGSPFVTLSGYQPRPVARRASIAAPGGSTLTIWRLGGSSPATSSRGLSEVTKGTAALRSVYRPSSQAVYGRSAASIGLPQTAFARSSISRERPHSSIARSTASVGVPRATTIFGSTLPVRASQSTLTSSATGSSFGAPRSRPLYRRASISTYGRQGHHHGEEFIARDASPEIPLAIRPYVSKGLTTTKFSAADVASPTVKRLSIKTFTNDGPYVDKFPKKIIDNDIHLRKKLDVESQLNDIVPVHEESLAKLRARTQQAKDHLSRHRILLDRYLPLQLGPEKDVNFEVEARYGELLSRMPHLEQRDKSHKADDEYKTVIPPYKPAAATTKGQKLAYEISNVDVKSSFTPKISDTRKRARSVLCKVKGDPRYFDF